MSYFLKPGYIFFASKPTVILTVLGSSVAITLYHRKKKIGGMNHFVRPQIVTNQAPTALYAVPSTHKLIAMFRDKGFGINGIEAHLFGGASPENASTKEKKIGVDNLYEAEKLLYHYNIPIVGKDVGGTWGRKIAFNSGTGEIIIAKVNRIRDNDWFYDLYN